MTINHIIKKYSPSENVASFIPSVLLFVVISLSCVYIYLLGTLSLDIIARKNLEQEIKNARSELSILEIKYLSFDKELTLDYAQSIGFVEDKKTEFAQRQSNVAFLDNGTISKPSGF